jgi:SAM-dependent methyltransferase
MDSTAGDSATVRLFDLAIRCFGRGEARRVLDFGCGAGALVRGLEAAGYESYGCDFPGSVSNSSNGQFRQIQSSPEYSLPFPDEHFDVVVSTGVLEHAQNKRECFAEMRRILKRDGFAVHLFPARKFLPFEPHIYVPLANWLWPRCPLWWFAFWALTGVRNDSQKGMTWRDVAEKNKAYSASGLSYWSTRAIEQLANEVFGNCTWPMRFYLENAGGRYARWVGSLPLRGMWDFISREYRYSFLLMRRTS